MATPNMSLVMERPPSLQYTPSALEYSPSSPEYSPLTPPSSPLESSLVVVVIDIFSDVNVEEKVVTYGISVKDGKPRHPKGHPKSKMRWKKM